MKKFLFVMMTAGLAVSAHATTINLSTGVANWQVFNNGLVAATALTGVQANGSWAPSPAGSTWISYGSIQGTSCVVGQTPGNGCANTLVNPSGDTWLYQLDISAATLGATSGVLNFIFGADSRVDLFIGNGTVEQSWNTGTPTNGNGFNPLGCSATGGSTSAGNTQATYNTCTTTVGFTAANLNGDGSLSLFAHVSNDPIAGCPECGNPTGFILEGAALTGQVVATTPEPSTFSMLALAGLAAMVFRLRGRRTLPQS